MSDLIHRIVLPSAMVAAVVAPAWGTTYLTVNEAQKAAFGSGAQFQPADQELAAGQVKRIESDSGVRVRGKTQKVWRVTRGDTFLGWFIEDEVLGKHEFITWCLALNADGTVKDIEILDYRETYGYEIRNEKWRQQFYGKQHGAKLKLDSDIKNISGATLSCRHITDGVKRLLSFYEIVLKR